MIRFQMPPERSSVHWKGGMIESLSGRLLLGQLHDWTGGWAATGWIFALLGVGAIIAGLGAGRARYVHVASERL